MNYRKLSIILFILILGWVIFIYNPKIVQFIFRYYIGIFLISITIVAISRLWIKYPLIKLIGKALNLSLWLTISFILLKLYSLF